MKTKILSIVLTGLLLISTSAYARDRGPEGADRFHKGPEKGARMMEEIMDELDLTDVQKTQLEELKKPSVEEFKKRREEVKAINQELKKELDKAETDKAKIDSLVDKLVAFEREKIEKRVEHILKVKEILTPEQFELLKQKMEIKQEVWKELRKMRKEKQGKGRFSRHNRGDEPAE